jgi:O-antigen/teichoic acid export membrane protein
MSAARTLLRGSFVRNADLLIGLGVAFCITPMIVRSLGDRMYGVWTLLGTFVGYYGVLDLGLSSAASRYISRSLGQGDLENLDSVASTAFFLFCVLGAVALLATLAAGLACRRFIHDPVEAALVQKIVLLLGSATAVGFPLRVYAGILTSYLRFDALSSISIARTLACNAAIYWCLGAGGGIMAIAVVTFAGSLLQNAAAYAACAALYPHIKVSVSRFDRTKLRMLFDHSWKTLLCFVNELVRFRLDAVLIACYLSVGLVTFYSIGARLVDGFCQLVLNSVGVMAPLFSQYEGAGDYDAIRGALLMATRFSAVITAYVGFSLLFYGQAFILRWMGPGYESSYWVAVLLGLGFFLHLPQSPGVQLLYGLSKHESYAVLTFWEGALNLALSLIFLMRYGMYGVALGTAVEMLVFKLLLQPAAICRAVELPVRTYMTDMLGTLAKAGGMLAVYFLLIRGLVRPDYARLFVCGAAQTLLFIPAAYILVIRPEDRRFLRRLAASILESAAAKTDHAGAGAPV